jgi:hypothetical protein
MLIKNLVILFSVLTVSIFSFETSAKDDLDRKVYQYQITVTNLTKGNAFSRIVAYSHKKGYQVYSEGQESSEGLAAMSQSGLRFGEFVDELEAINDIFEITVADNILLNGQTTTVTVDASHKNNYVSLAAMIAPTNDGFIALNGIKGPHHFNKINTYYLHALDSGSEANTELCDRGQTLNHNDPNSIPMPLVLCIGTQSGIPVLSLPLIDLVEEGYVHTHPGIKGIGDLHPAIYDWKNPVAKVMVKRIK